MKSLALILTLSSTVFAGVYDYGYLPGKEVAVAEQKNPLFYGNFERIIRYDALKYSGADTDLVTLEADQNTYKMLQSIQSYVTSGVPYKVSIVGHTRLNKEHEYENVQESTFFGSLQNRWLESVSDAKANRNGCEKAIESIKKQLIDYNVKEEEILAECRDGANPHYLENDKDARALNHQILVTLYTSKPPVKPVPLKAPVVQPVIVAKPAPVVVATPAVVVTPLPEPIPAPVVADVDSDKDGVLDSKDQCPRTPKGYVVDEKGCPVEVTLHINFATSSHKIPPSATKEIEKLKNFMKEYSGYSIEIAGHTDSIGEADKNLILSDNRAKALATTLIKGGIAAERIEAKGFGESQPIASNMEAQGRAQNRRVEVKMFANGKEN